MIITDIIQGTMSETKDLAVTQTQSNNLAVRIDAIRQRYGTAQQCLQVTFNPSNQAWYGQYPQQCVCGKAPYLIDVTRTYGKGQCLAWLAGQIGNFSEYSGAKVKLTAEQLTECAQIVYAKFALRMKVTDIMLFYFKLKCKDFGDVGYNTIDPIFIIDNLKKYCQYQGDVLDKYDREQAAQNVRRIVLSDEQIEKIKEIQDRIHKRWAEKEKSNNDQ